MEHKLTAHPQRIGMVWAAAAEAEADADRCELRAMAREIEGNTDAAQSERDMAAHRLEARDAYMLELESRISAAVADGYAVERLPDGQLLVRPPVLAQG